MGNVRTALYNWLFARNSGGTFILRIEDTDATRSERRYEEQLMEDMRWLGLHWDESVDRGDRGPYRQTERTPIYQERVKRLLDGGYAYYCFCSPEQLEEDRHKQLEAGRPTLYVGRCRGIDPAKARARLEAGEQATVRFRVRTGSVGYEDLILGALQIECEVISDFVLLRSDGSPQYNLACVVDDTLMEITHVIRGQGHVSNTYRQVLLYEALGTSAPAFAHLSTILAADGSKLSKRHGATSIDEFRNQGYLPEAMTNYLALLGWSPAQEGREILTLGELGQEFDLSRVNRSSAIFDPEKLKWVNRNHLKGVEQQRLTSLSLPYLQARGLISSDPSPAVIEWVGEVARGVLNHLSKLDELTEAARHVFGHSALSEDALAELSGDGTSDVIQAFRGIALKTDLIDAEAYRAAVAAVKDKTGRKGKQLFHPLRLALTGESSGLELERLVPLLETGKHLSLPVPIVGVAERLALVLAALEKSRR